MVSGIDVQAKIKAGEDALALTKNSYPQMVKTYGPNWKTDWPKASQWYIALSNFDAAGLEALGLVAHSPVADFAYKVQ